MDFCWGNRKKLGLTKHQLERSDNNGGGAGDSWDPNAQYGA